ncbi:MAG: hypothetical protein VX712_11340 [Bacteroidota bacterium]|uniref:hypothetical protein n=1 Tax=Christiangramia sp. TaxID=1931228 RepID=UPI002E8605F6|nr:hypothetical protein [Bacteroidota bacterium]
MIKVEKTCELAFTTLKFYKNFVVSTVHENSNLDESEIQELKDVIIDYYQNRPFVYISNRLHSYSVNPLIYVNLVQLNLLKGICIVCEDFNRLQTANFERQFATMPFDLFQDLEEAKAWAKGLINS